MRKAPSSPTRGVRSYVLHQHVSAHEATAADSNTGSHSGGGLTPRHDDDLLDGGHGVTSHPDGDGGLEGGGAVDGGDDGDMDSLFGDDSAPALRGLGAGGDDDPDNGLDELSARSARTSTPAGDYDDDFACTTTRREAHERARRRCNCGRGGTPTADSQATLAGGGRSSPDRQPPRAATADQRRRRRHGGRDLPPARLATPPREAPTSASTGTARTAPTNQTTTTTATRAAPRTPSLAPPARPDQAAGLAHAFSLRLDRRHAAAHLDLRAPRPAASFPSTPTSSALPHVPATSYVHA